MNATCVESFEDARSVLSSGLSAPGAWQPDIRDQAHACACVAPGQGSNSKYSSCARRAHACARTGETIQFLYLYKIRLGSLNYEYE